MNYDELEKKHHLLPGEGKRWEELAERYGVPLENEEKISRIYGVDFDIRLAKQGDTTAARGLLVKASIELLLDDDDTMPMPPNLREYIGVCLIEVVKDSDPTQAHKHLNIGRPTNRESEFYRDMQITADVHRAIQGLPKMEAYHAVAEEYGLDEDTVRKIYKKHEHAIEALEAIGELDNVLPP